jgi:hypothetical protein
MASNMDLIKERLAKLQSKGGGNGEKIDYAALFWKPKLGKQVVRVVPRKSNKDYPFVEVPFHQYNVFKKSVYCLEAFGEKDPVMQLVKELYNENTEDSKELAKKIRPRTKYFAQVVVRDEEEAGTRIWEFNKTTYEKLLTIMADDDYGDVSDISSGTDLTVEGYNDSVQIGKKTVNYIAVNITPKRKTAPLSEDAEEARGFLENQKDILEIYKKYTYDEIKSMLKNYLDPKEESEDEKEEEDEPAVKAEVKKEAPVEPAPAKALKPKPKPKAETKVTIPSEEDDDDDIIEKADEEIPKKKSNADKFNELFVDDPSF